MSAAIFLVLVLWVVASLTSNARAEEMSARDRLALLYAPQLNFTRDGDPLIRVGITSGKRSLTFTPGTNFRVLPNGEGGPEISLPGGVSYTVSIANGQGGAYRYWVVVEQVPYELSDSVDSAKQQWQNRGVEVTQLEVGSLFAISGQMFDNRLVLLVTGGMPTRQAAVDLQLELEEQHGIDARLHVELTDYPSGSIELAAKNKPTFTIRNQNLLWIIPDADGEIAVQDVSFEEGTQKQGEETRSYRGTLIFTPDHDGKLSMINEIPAERLLEGVVPAEIYGTAPSDSLKAQAVAARGTILSQVGVRHLADPFHLCDDQHCQVYGGVTAEKDATNRAVEDTRGQVLVLNKRLVETYYSSNCGGFSENNDNVWPTLAREYLRGHPDALDDLGLADALSEADLDAFLSADVAAFCNTDHFGSGKHFRWTKDLSATNMDQLVAKRFDIGRVRDVVITKRGVSGRIIELEIVAEKGRAKVERELAVRRLFGGLKSGLFLLEIERDDQGWPTAFHFRGGGFGHGVGMCQTGAMEMARRGFDYQVILSHYYPGALLLQVW